MRIRLTQVEALLRLERVDAAAALLAQVGDLPRELLTVVPSLERFRADARFAAVFARLDKR